MTQPDGPLGRVVVGLRQAQAALLVRGVPVRVGVAVQVAADHRLRLVPFGDLHRLDVALLAHPGVEADEVHEVGSLQQQLRHDRVVVALVGDVAVGAALGLGLPLGVRVVRREGLRGEAARGDRRLLDVDALAVDVGRGEHQRRRGAHRRDPAALHRAVPAELEHVVARDLRVVGREVARLAALVVVALGLPVGLDRQVAAAAARGPRQVAGEAGHLLVGVGVVLRARAPLALAALVARVHELRARRLLVVLRVAGRHRVLHQRHLPLAVRVHRGALVELAAAPLEALAPVLGAQQRHVHAARPRGGPGGAQRRVASSRCRGSRGSRSRPRRPPRRRCGRCRACPARSGSRRTGSPRRGGWR